MLNLSTFDVRNAFHDAIKGHVRFLGREVSYFSLRNSDAFRLFCFLGESVVVVDAFFFKKNVPLVHVARSDVLSGDDHDRWHMRSKQVVFP